MVPIYEAPDEPFHWRAAQYIYQTWMREVNPSERLGEANAPRRRSFELILMAAVLVAGLLGLFWEVFALGYVQVPGDILFTDPVLREGAPADFQRPQNSLLSDNIDVFYVLHSVAARAMQTEGHIPLWNPYILAGQPLVADAQSALFYPPNLLLFWLTPATVATVSALFNIFVAGIFTFLFCRSLKISLSGAVLAAISFAFSAAVMVVGPSHPIASSLVWMPLCFWGIENLLNGSNLYFWALVASIGIGLTLVGGHPETEMHVIMIVGLYVGARLVLDAAPVKVKARCGLIFVAAALVGCLLAAVQWLPFVDFLSHSGIVSRSRSSFQGSYFYTPEWFPNSTTLITLLYPNFFGNPENLTSFWPFSNYQNYLEQSMYFGLIPLALTSGAIVTVRKKNIPALILAVLALLSLAIALRLPGFEALNYLPILNRVNNTRLKWMFSFLGAVLAGFGMDGFRAYVLSRKKELKLFISASAAPIVAVLAIFLVAVMAKAVVALKWIPVPANVQKFLANIFSLGEAKTMVSVAVAAGAVGCFFVLRSRPQWLKVGEWIGVVLTLVELIVVARGYNTTMPPKLILPAVSTTQALQKDTSLYRVLAIPPTLWPNYGAVYGISSVGGYDLPVLKWSYDIHSSQGGTGFRQVWAPDWPLADWMNIKYVISGVAQNLPKLKLILAGNGYYVYENENASPRAYVTYQAEVIRDGPTALQRLVGGSFDFKREVLLDKDLPSDQAALIGRTTGDAPVQQVDVVAYKDDTVTLDVSTSAAGLLVMSDAYDPGWETRVDGNLSPLYRANYAYRAVFVPAGNHHIVQFTYRPWSFAWGLRLTLFGLLILLVGIPISLIGRHHLPAFRQV